MGGPGSGRRPTKGIQRGQLVKDSEGHDVYAERSVSLASRRETARSPRVELAATAMASGIAGTVSEAMRLAGYASDGGPTHERVKGRMLEAAEKAGVTPEKLMATVAEALEAKRTITTKDGWVEAPDTDARLRAVDMGLKVHGVGQERSGGVTVVFTLPRELT